MSALYITSTSPRYMFSHLVFTLSTDAVALNTDNQSANNTGKAFNLRFIIS